MRMKLIALTFFLISAFLTAIFFKDVPKNEFIYIQDEFLVLTKQENFNSFFTQSPTDLGTANTATMIVTFFDRLYYSTTNYFNLNIYDSEKALYFIKLFLIISLPFFGFKKLTTLFKSKSDDIVVFTISLWYSFNTFTLIYWHGNAFSLTLLICYALAPLALYYFHASVFMGKKITDKIIFAILLFLMSFALFFFAVFCLILVFYTALYTVLNKISLLTLVKNILKLSVLYLPFISILLLIPYDMFSNPVRTVNLAGGETYGNIQGGLLYQFLMWFTWAIYIEWQPRNVYTFDKYFLSIPSLAAPFVLYFLIIGGFLKKKSSLFLTLFSFLFLFLVFFAKAAQKPFGEIYLFLINHSNLFRIFRSPDNKLGFGIVLVVAILLLIVSNGYKKRLFISLLIGVILTQGYILFSGIAIKGENNLRASDRIILIDKEYLEVAAFINKNSLPYGYALPLPSVEVGHFELNDGSAYIGQDLLPKLTNLPFLYVSDSSGMLSNAHDKISTSLQKKEASHLEEFSIRYYIVRNSIRMKKINKEINQRLSDEFKSVFRNSRFMVYENPKAIPLVQSENVQFKIVNPVKYQLSLKNVKKSKRIILNQNYNANWKLYPNTDGHNNKCDHFKLHEQSNTKECPRIYEYPNFKDVFYSWTKPFPESLHKEQKGYANSWIISSDILKNNLEPNQYKINPDGSIDAELVLFLKTQSIFYAGVIISSTYLLVLSLILLINYIKVSYRRNLIQK